VSRLTKKKNTLDSAGYDKRLRNVCYLGLLTEKEGEEDEEKLGVISERQ
jgi:hypothetical protein